MAQFEAQLQTMCVHCEVHYSCTTIWWVMHAVYYVPEILC